MIRNIFRACTGRRPAYLQQGFLPCGAAYTIRQLDIGWLDAIYQLHADIHARLKEEERTFITRKTREDFACYLRGQGEIVGVIVEGQLVAMGSVLLPSARHPYTATADMPAVPVPQDIAVIQSGAVLPAWRSQGLQKRLIEARLEIARRHGRRHALSIVDTRNTASIRSLLGNGFVITGQGVDPDDGGAIFHCRKKLKAGLIPLLQQRL